MNEEAPPYKPRLDDTWLAALGDVFQQDHMLQLKQFLVEEKRAGRKVYPPGSLIFNALNLTPFDQVRVVILGQDPYHGRGQAQGLCFSVHRGVTPPPSLINIFKELEQELSIARPHHGDLISWAKQGVLLLNTTLTVRAGLPKSHAGKGWEPFTDRVIQALDREREGLVFLLWGRHAQSKAQLIDGKRHLVLTAPHPSPYSADSGFFGCGHFARVNQHLETRGQAVIDWRLPA